jgi:hypothetical protein
VPSGDGFGESPFKQHLCDQRLGVNVGALAEKDEAGESE